MVMAQQGRSTLISIITCTIRALNQSTSHIWQTLHTTVTNGELVGTR